MQTTKPSRVLLVGTEPSFLDRAEHLMEAVAEAVDVMTEPELDAALAAIERRDDIDCAVMSATLPSHTELDLLDAIHKRDRQLPVVILTTGDEGATTSEVVEAGATNALRREIVQEQPHRLVSVVVQTVENRRSHQLLSEEFDFLDAVLDSLDDIVYVADTGGQPIYWNEAATRATGYTSDEARRLDLLELFPESDHDTVLTAVDTVLEEGSATFEADLLTKDGERLCYEFSCTALRNDEGEIIGVCGAGRNVGHRNYYENTLRALHRTTRELFAATTREEIARTAVGATEYIIDCPFSTVLLREDDRLVPTVATDETREHLDEIPAYDVDEKTPAARSYWTGETRLVEHSTDIGDEHSPMPGWGTLYVSLGEHGVLALGHQRGESITSTQRQLAELLAVNTAAALTRYADECALARRKRMLETLPDTTRELIRTSEPSEIAETIVADTEEILDLTATAVYLWDADEGVLCPVAESDGVEALFGELTTVDGRDGRVWEAFVDAETRVETGADAESSPEAPPNRMYVPIGDHGVLVSGSTDPAAFTETAVGFAELLAAITATALDRAVRERALVEKDRQLEQRNEELRRLDRLNAIIRTINEGLIQAGSRAEVMTVVCETLSEVEHYRFTWIGGEPLDGGATAPFAFAGEGRSILEHVVPETGESTSIPERVRAGDDRIVVNDIHRDPRAEPWRKTALNNGFRSMACFPVRFEDQEFGFLEIYADQVDLFTDEEVAVLSELVVYIANAIDAVERKEALLTGRETQLEFAFVGIDDPLARFVERTETTVTVDGLVPHGTGGWVVYATVHDTDAETVTAAVARSSRITDVDVLRGGNDVTLVSLTVADLAVINALARRNATVRSFSIGPEGGRATVTVPPSTDVREYVESCQDRLPALELVGRQTVAGDETSTRLKYDLADVLTEKQLEAVQTAYFTGYFDWPRDATGVDVAESLDVSPPTFQQHLRKSLQRIFERTFEVQQ